MNVGEQWIYRAREYSVSERVEILKVIPTKQKPRAEVKFLDGEREGATEIVPSLRLRGDWSSVANYDAIQANWSSIEGWAMSEIEDSALYTVFRELIPQAVAELVWNPVHNASRIHAAPALERLIDHQLAVLLSRVTHFEDGDDIVLSPEGSMILAELACRSNPETILDWVVAEETKQQELVTNGEVHKSLLDGEDHHFSPQQKYRHYLKHYRPIHELLRQWCGHRAVTAQERIDAAEAEVGRLIGIVTEAISALEEFGQKSHAEQIKCEFREERITSWNVRPIVERPLSIDEMPIRYVGRKRSWPRQATCWGNTCPIGPSSLETS